MRLLHRAHLAALLACGTAFGGVLTPQDALAQVGDSDSAKRRVIVGELQGAKTQSTRTGIIQGLEQDYEVIGSDEVKSLRPGASDDEVRDLARRFEADAVVMGKTQVGKKGWSAELEVRDGRDGSLIETVTVVGKTFGDFERAVLSSAEVSPVVERAQGQPRPEPVVAQKEEPEAVEQVSDAPTAPPEKLRPSPLQVLVGARLYSRGFRYTDTFAQFAPSLEVPDLTTYNLAAAPMPFAHITWYPGAHFTDEWISHVGLRGGYELGVGTQVSYRGALLDQDHNLWFAGLRGRIPVSVGEFGLLADFAQHSFTIRGDEDTAGVPAFPDTSYQMVELGADTEWRVEGVILSAYAKYLAVVGTGQISEDAWYPNASATGVNLGAAVGLELSRVIDLMVGLDARMYGLDFRPIDPTMDQSRVAAGATDTYLSVWAGLGFRWPGDEPTVAKVDASSSGASSGSDDDFDDFDDFD